MKEEASAGAGAVQHSLKLGSAAAEATLGLGLLLTGL